MRGGVVGLDEESPEGQACPNGTQSPGALRDAKVRRNRVQLGGGDGEPRRGGRKGPEADITSSRERTPTQTNPQKARRGQ